MFPSLARLGLFAGLFARQATTGVSLNLGGVRVGAQGLSAHAGHNVHEASVVLHALLRPEKKTHHAHSTQRYNSGRVHIISVDSVKVDLHVCVTPGVEQKFAAGR